jgi:hypothetical protein
LKSSEITSRTEEQAAPPKLDGDAVEPEQPQVRLVVSEPRPPAPPSVHNNSVPPDDRRMSDQFVGQEAPEQEPRRASRNRGPPSVVSTRSSSTGGTSRATQEPEDPSLDIIGDPLRDGEPANLIVDDEDHNGNSSQPQRGVAEARLPPLLLNEAFRGESEHVEDAEVLELTPELTDGSGSTEWYEYDISEEILRTAPEPLARVSSRRPERDQYQEAQDPVIESSSQAQKRARNLSNISEESGSYVEPGINVGTWPLAAQNVPSQTPESLHNNTSNQTQVSTEQSSSREGNQANAAPTQPTSSMQTGSRALPDLPKEEYKASKANNYRPERKSSLCSSSEASEAPVESESTNQTEAPNPPARQALVEDPIDQPRNLLRTITGNILVLERQAPELVPRDLNLEEPRDTDVIRTRNAVVDAVVLRRISAQRITINSAIRSSNAGSSYSTRVGEASSSSGVGAASSSTAGADGMARAVTASSETFPHSEWIEYADERFDSSAPPPYDAGEHNTQDVSVSAQEVNSVSDSHVSEEEDIYDDHDKGKGPSSTDVRYAQFELPQIPIHELGLDFNDGSMFCQTRLPYSFDSEISPPRLGQFKWLEQSVQRQLSSVVPHCWNLLCDREYQESEHSQSSGSYCSSGCSSRSSSLSGSSREFFPLDAPVVGNAMIPGYLLSSDAYEGPLGSPDEVKYQEVQSFKTKIFQPIPISNWMEHVEFIDGSNSSESQINSPSTSLGPYQECPALSYFDQSPESSQQSTPVWHSPLSTPGDCTSSFIQAEFPFPDCSHDVLTSQQLYQQWASEHLQEQEEKRSAFRAKMQDIKEQYETFLNSTELENVDRPAGSDGSSLGTGGVFDGPDTDEYWTDDEFFYVEPPPRKPVLGQPKPQQPPPMKPGPRK